MFQFHVIKLCRSYYPEAALTASVWAVPRSLATTWEITVVFSSSRYLDVSVPWVCSSPCGGCHAFSVAGCPIRISADHFVFANPRGFSQLITSFFASESLGIPHTPLLNSSSRASTDTRTLLTQLYIVSNTTYTLRFSFLPLNSSCQRTSLTQTVTICILISV